MCRENTKLSMHVVLNVFFRDCCPLSGESRWQLENILNPRHKPLLWKKLRYLHKVAKTFNCGENEKAFNCELSTKLINHASSKMDSSSRKQVNFQWINFTAEARNVCLWFLMDKFNPFGNKNNYYNCWHVMIALFNLPVSIFMHVKGVYCVIESHNSPWHDIDVYLQLLVDELNELWSIGAINILPLRVGSRWKQFCFVI